MRGAIARHTASHKLLKAISFRFFPFNTLTYINNHISENEMGSEMLCVSFGESNEQTFWHP
jgi:hypothetical protein